MSHPAQQRRQARAQQRRQDRERRQQMTQVVRAQREIGSAAPPPSAGAVNLENLKGGDPAKQMKVAEGLMKQQGFMCSCGQRFRDEGIAAMGYNLGRFPEQKMVMTAEGPQASIEVDDGCQFFVQGFCSRQCPDYLDALSNGLPVEKDSGMIRPKIRAIRSLPPVEWLDESSTSSLLLPGEQ